MNNPVIKLLIDNKPTPAQVEPSDYDYEDDFEEYEDDFEDFDPELDGGEVLTKTTWNEAGSTQSNAKTRVVFPLLIH
jgi:hypothetical protein